MSNTQGETSRNRIYGAITAAVLVLTLGGVGVGVAKANADAVAHTTLMAEVKTDGRTLNASAGEDAALYATAARAAQVKHINAVAAQQTATRIAAEKAAAVEAARVAAEQAAAQQAAQQQAAEQAAQAQQQPEAANDSPPATGGGSSAGLPAGSPVPKIADGSTQGFRWDTQACASHNASGNPATCD